ncbi:hypothetical protein GGI07_001892 [Coemansia sp. Benny D115]|nr:hypothetical protein GGI07_001892 [Coemansia sp. Benny D115]
MTVAEQYLHSDIPCGLKGCTKCPRNKALESHGVPMLQQAGVVVVPDVSFVSRYIKLLESEESLQNLVFCQTVLDALDHRGFECSGQLANIEVHGQMALNRACSGDTVVVRLLAHGEGERNCVSVESKFNYENNDGSANCVGGAELVDVGNELSAYKSADSNCKPALCGVVVGIMQRSWRPFVATLQVDLTGSSWHLAVPVNASMPKIRMHYVNTATLEGMYFVVVVDGWPEDMQYPQGHFVHVLGPVGDVDAEIDVILVEHQIAPSQATLEFPQAVLHEMPTNANHDAWQPPAEALEGRYDLRDWLTFSIDPYGCQDIDDVLSMRKVSEGNGGYELGVHIADVTHYVQPGSATDAEAQARGTTVYLADRRFNMLPEALSEHACSLHAGVDRLAVSVVWKLDASMKLQSVWYGRTVIHSAAALSYEQAQSLLDGHAGGQGMELDECLHQSICDLTQAMHLLRQQRVQDGALELASTEVKFGFNPDTRAVAELVPKQPLEVHHVVEEAMVLANSAVARRIHRSFPQAAMLRHHQSPTVVHRQLLAALAADNKGLGLETMQFEPLFTKNNSDNSGCDSGFQGPSIVSDLLVAQPHWVAATAHALNVSNRQAKLAQRESTNLFQALYVQEKLNKGASASDFVVSGVVAEVRTNGLVVYIPSLGLRGPVHLVDSAGNIKLPVSALTGNIADIDNVVEGCSDFVANSTELSIKLPASGVPGMGRQFSGNGQVLRFHVFDHLHVALHVLASGRHRPQVYLSLFGCYGSEFFGKKQCQKTNDHQTIAGSGVVAVVPQHNNGQTQQPQDKSTILPLVADDEPQLQKTNKTTSSKKNKKKGQKLVSAQFYSVMQKFEALSLLETSCDVQTL